MYIGDIDGDSEYLSSRGPIGYVAYCMFECELCHLCHSRNVLGTDTGGRSSSAIEMRHKMKSRQSCYEAVGGGDVVEDFTICSQINQHSIDWALDHAPKRTLTRFLEFGEALRVGPDQYSKTGTHWTYSPLNETRMCDQESGRYFTAVQSRCVSGREREVI